MTMTAEEIKKVSGELDTRVLQAVKDGNEKFADICLALNISAGGLECRQVDRALQRLRRVGVIVFNSGKWRAA